MASIASFSGLASGIQWQDLIDQIMAAESARRVTPLNSQIALQKKRADAWRSYQGVVTKFADAAKALRDGAAFGSYKVAAGTGAGGRALLSATASASAAPGRYAVEVVSLAKAEKLSGNVVQSATTALGIEGEFAINGKKVTVAASDTLASIRDRINAANTGSSPSRVSASILSTGSGEHRLVLTSDTAGAAGIDLTDGETGVLRQLGVVDEATVANTTASGGTASRRLTSVTTAIAAALGVTMPQPSTIRVGDRTITVDLNEDSLSAIAAKIQAAGVPARTVSETVDGRTTHRLEVEGEITSDGSADSQRTLEVLGFVQPGRDAVRQVVAGENAWTAGGVPATGATLLTDVVAVGDAPALGVGSVVTIRGTRGDGVAVQASEFTVQAGSTVDDLLAQITAAYGGPRSAQATLGADGTIRLTDSQGGESKLSLSLGVAANADPATPEAALLGRTVVETAGRLREVSRGADAVIRVDGSTVTRGGNTISDVIAGVTLSLQHAEPGTEIAVDVTRDDAATVKAIKDFAAAYNEIASFVKAQTAQGAPLAFNGTLRSTMSQITNVLLTDQEGLPAGSAFDRATLAGVSLTRTGTLEVDEKRLTEVMATNFADLKTLFGTDGVGGAMTKVTDILTRSGDGTIAMQQDSISTSISSLERRVSDAESRLELRREAMLRQFASMEAALARMQSQGNWLTQQVGSLPSWSQK